MNILIKSPYAGRVASITIFKLPELDNDISTTIIEVPTQSRSHNGDPFSGQIEYAIYGGEGRIYAMIGFHFQPDTRNTLRIIIPDYTVEQPYESEITRHLKPIVGRDAGIFHEELRADDIEAIKKGINEYADDYELGSGTCYIICGSWLETGGSWMSHRIFSSQLILIMTTLSTYTPGSITDAVVGLLRLT